MAHSRTDDMRREPQGLSTFLPAENVRETGSETRFQATDGLARYIIDNQKETK